MIAWTRECIATVVTCGFFGLLVARTRDVHSAWLVRPRVRSRPWPADLEAHGVWLRRVKELGASCQKSWKGPRQVRVKGLPHCGWCNGRSMTHIRLANGCGGDTGFESLFRYQRIARKGFGRAVAPSDASGGAEFFLEKVLDFPLHSVL